ncbi:MAG: hypothetical protein M3N68_11975, partial [Actinomycetota bacterium]|nr:hypothetical protein [Actinomycetota bacterium]
DDSGDTTTALSPTVTAGRAETSGPAGGVLDGGDLGEESDAQALARTVEDALEGGPARRGSASRPQSTRASPGQADSAAAPAAMEDVMACAEAARGLLGPDPGELVYTAAVRYQGTPAVVLAFRVAPAAQADDADEPRRAHRVVVMAREGCRPLVVQAL